VHIFRIFHQASLNQAVFITKLTPTRKKSINIPRNFVKDCYNLMSNLRLQAICFSFLQTKCMKEQLLVTPENYELPATDKTVLAGPWVLLGKTGKIEDELP
tara:strand:- start:210 stop:512 length:303 start_codon:yes stop_codon:yes gene_type:complete